MIRSRAPRQLYACLILVLVGALAGCDGSLFNSQEEATLIVRAPASAGAMWEVVISVANISDGLTGIDISDGGITLRNVDESTVTATGLNGFIVTAQDFEAPAPSGTLMAVSPEQAVTGGKILKLRFQASGANPTLTLHKSKVTLLSEQGTYVTSWELAATTAAE